MVLTIRTKEGMIQQMYDVIDRVSYRADMNKFTHTGRQILTSCLFLDDANNNSIMSKILV